MYRFMGYTAEGMGLSSPSFFSLQTNKKKERTKDRKARITFERSNGLDNAQRGYFLVIRPKKYGIHTAKQKIQSWAIRLFICVAVFVHTVKGFRMHVYTNNYWSPGTKKVGLLSGIVDSVRLNVNFNFGFD